ncbi:MAG: hypothetical protein L3K19_03445 [Thermoplasmata archaeon]|nr:hypothetical protein [Thermoplasmata archaeon]
MIRAETTLAVLFFASIPLGFLLSHLSAFRSLAAILYMVGAACGIAASLTLSAARAHKSEVVGVAYRSIGKNPIPTASSPATYELTLSYSHVASSNLGTQQEVRGVRFVLADRPELAEVPARMRERILGG